MTDSRREDEQELLDEALAACEAEPIHIPGSIQPHGRLLALRLPDLVVTAVSANAARRPEALLGRPWADIVDAASAAALRAALDTDLDEANPVPLVGPDGIAADGVLHHNGTDLIVELEAADTGPASALGWYQQLRRILHRLQACQTVADLCGELVVQVRALTGFDRVMAYRFDQEWNGEVVAEASASGLDPFLGLRFPAGDIPANARALYTTNWLRLIPSSSYEPVPLLGLTDAPVDLSASLLRSVSPVHLQYLANMGVAASMSLSIVVDGALWGLVSCHHYEGAHPLPYRIRAAAELVARTASILMASALRAQFAQERIGTAQRRSELTATLAGSTDDPGEVLVRNGDKLVGIVGADGAVVSIGGIVRRYGTTLEADEGVEVARRLIGGGAEAVATDCLADLDPSWSRSEEVAAGALAAPIGEGAANFVLWTNGQLHRTVTWGGNPDNKELRVTEDGPRLSPRRSFEAWTEEVRGRSRPWSEPQLVEAGVLGRNLADLILRRSVERDVISTALARTLLLEELPTLPGVTADVRYVPWGGSAFGGDWYEVLYRPDGHVSFAIGDVAGHGMAVASITSQLRQGLRAYLLREEGPDDAVTRLNELVSWVLPRDMATVLVVDLDPATGEVRWASAGHPPAMVIDGSGPHYLRGRSGPPLGVGEGATYPSNHHRLDVGDVLVIYSDGLVERRGEAIDSGLDRLLAAAAALGRDPSRLCEGLQRAAGRPGQDDDMTVLALRRDGN